LRGHIVDIFRQLKLRAYRARRGAFIIILALLLLYSFFFLSFSFSPFFSFFFPPFLRDSCESSVSLLPGLDGRVTDRIKKGRKEEDFD